MCIRDRLVYDKTGRLLFTKEMAQEYTILAPQMLPDHFAMLENILQEAGYKVKMLNTTGHTILEEGQKYVHNDACFPAILVIGQLIDAIHRGGYDPHKVALFITQDVYKRQTYRILRCDGSQRAYAWRRAGPDRRLW